MATALSRVTSHDKSSNDRKRDGHLDHDVLRLFSALGNVHRLSPGEILVHQGTEVQYVDLLEQGSVKLVDGTASGGDRIIGTRDAGHVVGGCYQIRTRTHPFSVVTLDACIVTRLPISEYLRLVRSDHTFTSAMLAETIREAELLAYSIARFTAGPAKDRVRELLRALATSRSHVKVGEFCRVVTPLREWEMAQLVAMTPEHFNRTLRALESAKLVRRDRGWIMIPRSLVT